MNAPYDHRGAPYDRHGKLQPPLIKGSDQGREDVHEVAPLEPFDWYLAGLFSGVLLFVIVWLLCLLVLG